MGHHGMQGATTMYETLRTEIPLDSVELDNPRKDAAVLHHCNIAAGALRLVMSPLAGAKVVSALDRL